MSLPRYPQYKNSKVEWLGRVPHGWDVMRLMRVASVNDDVLPESTSPTFEIEYVDIGSVSLDRGIERAEKLIFSDAPSRARRLVRDGDVLVSTVRTYLKAIAPVENQPENLVVSTGFAVIRPMLKLCPGYAKYALQTTGFVDEVISRSTGVSYPAINASDLVRISIPVPSLDEQAAIATFLDRETAKIDTLIAEQEKLIALLAEKRQATVSHAVTRGLKPDAPMKDSGVAWLGKVPAHWTVCAVRRVLISIEQGWSPECVNRPAEGREWGVLKAGCVNGGTFSPNENKALPEALTPNQDIEVRNGDLLMSRASGSPALVGSIAYVSEPPPRLMLSDKIFRIHLQPVVSPRFFAAAFASRYLRHQIEQAISGAEGLANNLPQSSLKSFTIAVPPADEQTNIVAFVEAEIARLGALTAEAERVIALLKERRNALISVTVTGQINVHGIVSQSAVREEIAA
jgi:type I restriction enzyme, S subunit